MTEWFRALDFNVVTPVQIPFWPLAGVVPDSFCFNSSVIFVQIANWFFSCNLGFLSYFYHFMFVRYSVKLAFRVLYLITEVKYSFITRLFFSFVTISNHLSSCYWSLISQTYFPQAGQQNLQLTLSSA